MASICLAIIGLSFFIIGFIAGRSSVSAGIPDIGTLVIDTTDKEDGPYLFLELSDDVDTLSNKKRVQMTVTQK